MDVGRSRGRGRAGPGPPEAGAPSTSEGSVPSIRVRPAETLRTIPKEITITTGDNAGGMKIVTNYFRLRVPNDQVVYGYRVDFEPNVESIRVRRGLVFSLSAVFNKAYIFDGGNEIKSLQDIKTTTTTEATTRDGKTISIRIKPTWTVGLGHAEMLRLYNTQMRRNIVSLGFINVFRNHYDKNARRLLSDHDIEIWPGISTAVNEHDGGILMCIDIFHKIIRSETALDILQRLKSKNPYLFKELAQKELDGKIVMTKYNNKTYRILHIRFDKNPVSCTFDRRGTTITLKDYYKERYQHICTDEQQPLLWVYPTTRHQWRPNNEDILLIPEFCLMTGLTESMKNNSNFKLGLNDATQNEPPAKTNALMAFMRRIRESETIRKEMDNWSLGFEDKLVELNSRLLPGERIQTFGEVGESSGVPYAQHTGNFEREIRSKKMKNPAKMENWCLIALRKDKAIIDDFFAHLKRVCVPLGVEIGPPKMFPVDNDRVQLYLDACKGIPEASKFCIIVVPNNNADRYSAVKRYFCCERPVPSQVITTRVLSNKKNLMSVATKILIQMSTKLGAEPWGLHIPPKSTMIIGYDTYHDSEKRAQSVGGFVCSTNGSATSWFSRTTYHQNREELSANFASNFRAGLKNWYQKNGGWPGRIIIYRDGVSEGQIPHVYTVELKEMQKVLTEKEGLAQTGFAFVIVTKRVNARFFLAEGRDLKNPPPGSLLNSIVTRKERYDFYLISQSVRQGTVNPTMYNIIADSTGWKALHHQQLAYKLCHLYYNWAGTITVPAPCQYAHKLAHLTGTALHKEHHLALSHTLFFL